MQRPRFLVLSLLRQRYFARITRSDRKTRGKLAAKEGLLINMSTWSVNEPVPPLSISPLLASDLDMLFRSEP